MPPYLIRLPLGRGIRACGIAGIVGALAFGAPATRAASASATVAAALWESLTRDLGAHFNVEGELVLDPVRPWDPAGDEAADAGDPARWSVRLVEFPAVLSSAMIMRVRVVDPQGKSADETLPVRAQLWRKGWVARAPLERGAALDPDACDLRRIDALREREALSTGISQPTDWMFQRAVPAGRLISWRDVTRRALVRKGDVIEVAAVEGPLQVTLKAQAMQDGGRGETVRVRNLDSKREFAARVVAPNRAEVRF